MVGRRSWDLVLLLWSTELEEIEDNRADILENVSKGRQQKKPREEIRKLSTSGPSKGKTKFSEVLGTEESENSFPAIGNFWAKWS